jgi:hypothetical protein
MSIQGIKFGGTGNDNGIAVNISASTNSTLTTLSALSLPGSQITGAIAGNAANITASSNSTLTTLSALSLPYSQLTGAPAALIFANSLVNTSGTVALKNDVASHTASQYYGTNASSVLGYFNLPAAGTGTAPTLQSFKAANYYTFTVTSANATVGATYTNNTQTFTVVYTIAAGTTLVCSATGAPTASGTLTKATGTGDATITYSAEAANGTYVLPSGPAPLYLRIRMIGAGGGGGATINASAATTGGNTTFGSSFLTANGGTGGAGVATVQPAGGTATITGLVGIAMTGSPPQLVQLQASTSTPGGTGASSPLGGAGIGGTPGAIAGTAAVANSGSGGGGSGGTAGNAPGTGGAAGGYIDVIVTSPSSTYIFNVGAGGAGATGTPAGGKGGSGVIYVEEYYQ